MISLAALAVFSGLSLNLLLQFAVGAAGVAGGSSGQGRGQGRRALPLFQLAVLFVAVLFLWMVFSYVLPSHWGGFPDFFLFFPVSALVCMGFELLGERILLLSPRVQQGSGAFNKVFSSFTAYDGLVPVSLIIALTLGGGFREAFVISLFFALGNMSAVLILNEIRRRAALERAPHSLRGSPLILVSMGLLSFISAAAAGICLRILDVF